MEKLYEKEITKNNALIAEFIGFKKELWYQCSPEEDKSKWEDKHFGFYDLPFSGGYSMALKDGLWFVQTELKFHSDWNWIMYAVKEICKIVDKLDFNAEITEGTLRIKVSKGGDFFFETKWYENFMNAYYVAIKAIVAYYNLKNQTEGVSPEKIRDAFNEALERFPSVQINNDTDVEKLAEKEAEGRYPVLTHSQPNNSPYVGSKETFKHGVRFGYYHGKRDTQDNSLSIEEAFTLCRLMFSNDYRPISKNHDEWLTEFKRSMDEIINFLLKQKRKEPKSNHK
jgi:hypothetical protein